MSRLSIYLKDEVAIIIKLLIARPDKNIRTNSFILDLSNGTQKANTKGRAKRQKLVSNTWTPALRSVV
jgi:hypothetical protein